MEIHILSLKDIFPYYNNPRDNKSAVAPVVESIKKYGFVKPIICDKNNVIIAGHTRYIAAFQLGMEYVPVIYSDLNDEQVKLYRIADNKLAEKSFYDENKLIEELKNMEVPEELQSFFFEDITRMVRFSSNDFSPMISDDYEQQDDIYDIEDESEVYNNTPSYNSSDPVVSTSSEIQDTPHSSSDKEEKTSSLSTNGSVDYFHMFRKDGKTYMNVICPYCGNKELIEIVL